MKMNIKPKEVTIRELTNNFEDHGEGGVIGYGGKLDIRPEYQREFVYKDKQRDAVIDTAIKEFPLNTMFWAILENGKFEIIDGQQRTISLCQYVNGDFAYKGLYFHNLKKDQQEQILNYKLMVHECSGEPSEKLKWFRIVNISGEKLSEQELKNAVYAGSWVTNAKKYFSKKGCPAYCIGNDYLKGEVNRQHHLESAIKWISNDEIEDYMGKHQHDENSNELWENFQSLIDWISSTFTTKRPWMMKGVDWGTLYNTYKDKKLNSKKIEKETKKLMADDDITKKSGIYPYILTRDEKYLSVRAFKDDMKQKIYEKQKSICPICKKHFEISEMEGDHITPWHEGGKTNEENLQMLCKNCNRTKGGK